MSKRFMSLCFLPLLLSVAVALAQDDQPLLLRYKWEAGQRLTWDLTARATGRISVVTGQQAGQSINVNVVAAMALFADALDMTEDGYARLRISFGAISVDVTLPDGQTLSTQVDLAAGKVRIINPAGGAPGEVELPAAFTELFGKGFVVHINDRGKILRIEDAEAFQALLQKMAGPQASSINLPDLVSWIEPVLPEQPVKPGDQWTEEKHSILGITQTMAGPAQLTVKHRHAGYTNIEGIRCAKIESSFEVSGLDLTTQPQTTGLTQEIKGLSVRVFVTSYLSTEDTHVLAVNGQITETGTISQRGTVKLGAQETDVDQTVYFDGLTVNIEASRTP
jgi:hypothetical protein